LELEPEQSLKTMASRVLRLQNKPILSPLARNNHYVALPEDRGEREVDKERSRTDSEVSSRCLQFIFFSDYE
jgi:hypothetical protein